jgi:hypothetical protein
MKRNRNWKKNLSPTQKKIYNAIYGGKMSFEKRAYKLVPLVLLYRDPVEKWEQVIWELCTVFRASQELYEGLIKLFKEPWERSKGDVD